VGPASQPPRRPFLLPCFPLSPSSLSRRAAAVERRIVQLSPPLPDASTRPEAHHAVQATYPHLFSAPPRGASNPSQPGVLLPIPATGDVRGEGVGGEEAGSAVRNEDRGRP
jgi:hypothetical protein